MGLFLSKALAIDNLCFSPPESLTPFSPIIVSYLYGSSLMNSSANDCLAASIICSKVALRCA